MPGPPSAMEPGRNGRKTGTDGTEIKTGRAERNAYGKLEGVSWGCRRAPVSVDGTEIKVSLSGRKMRRTILNFTSPTRREVVLRARDAELSLRGRPHPPRCTPHLLRGTRS